MNNNYTFFPSRTKSAITLDELGLNWQKVNNSDLLKDFGPYKLNDDIKEFILNDLSIFRYIGQDVDGFNKIQFDDVLLVQCPKAKLAVVCIPCTKSEDTINAQLRLESSIPVNIELLFTSILGKAVYGLLDTFDFHLYPIPLLLHSELALLMTVDFYINVILAAIGLNTISIKANYDEVSIRYMFKIESMFLNVSNEGKISKRYEDERKSVFSKFLLPQEFGALTKIGILPADFLSRANTDLAKKPFDTIETGSNPIPLDQDPSVMSRFSDGIKS